MNWLITTSLHLRLPVVATAIVLIIVGIRSADSIPLDVFPEFAPPLVEIQTEVPGISTEDVESLVSVPIENALNGVPFVKTIRSKSVLGLSSVRLIFQPNTDLLIARQLVQERLATVAATLPMIARPPTILPPLSSLSRCMKIMLISHYRHLIHEEGEPWGPGLLMRGAEERLAPILMTVLAAGLSLLPLVISGTLPGQEIEYPMAWVILLGLASATLVNLFVLPVGCAMFLKQIPANESQREALAPCYVPGEKV
jgi:Cu/Ag efflux pump CusA